jgi:hypothetical protein
MRKRALLFIIGLGLLLASAPVLWMQGREALLGSRTYDRYAVEQINAMSTTLNGHSLSITPTTIVAGSETFRRISTVDVALLKLSDRTANQSRALAVERQGGQARKSWRYRIIALNATGETSVDTFTFNERAQKPYRVVVARFVSPEPIGFTNESLQQWPSALYPLLYPWLTAIIGTLALLMANRKPDAAAAA